ncbi:MAG: hypothetical protein R3F53_14085 [Gammaproteobacteria bacterium]
MLLTIGLSTLIIALLGAGLAVRISRNTRFPGWIRDEVIGMVYLPILTGVLAVGLGYVVYGLYQLAYGYALPWTPDTLYGALLTAVLLTGLRWQPARRFVFGQPEQPVFVQSAPVLSVVPVSVGHDHNEFRPAA